jgi:hypothetical protein
LVRRLSGIAVELTPEQPDQIADAIEAVLAAPTPSPGPWWQAGLEESLQPSPPGPATA